MIVVIQGKETTPSYRVPQHNSLLQCTVRTRLSYCDICRDEFHDFCCEVCVDTDWRLVERLCTPSCLGEVPRKLQLMIHTDCELWKTSI